MRYVVDTKHFIFLIGMFGADLIPAKFREVNLAAMTICWIN